MANSNNSLNLVVQSSTGNGQQIIKIMRNSNGQPLTKEGVKAIVKEVTSQQNLLNNQTYIRQVGIKQETISPTKPTSIKLTPQQLAILKANQSTKIHTAQDIQFRNATSAIAGTSQSTTSNNTQHVVASSSATKKTQIGQNVISRRRKTDRLGKGLRHFSMKVCEKVKEKGKTTYNEVADELVTEEVQGQPIDPANYDQKNIRRRVYDALNVLMAMNIISKDKKEIRWIGLPTNSAQQCTSLEQENEKRKERIAVKKQQLRDLLLQLVSFKSLVTRNKEAEDNGMIPSQNSAIQLPFIIVNTHKKTHINCSISNDKSEYFFKFDNQFEIHDDIDVLKRMGLLLGLDKGECTYDDIQRAKTMVPQSFEKYIEIYGRGLEESSGDYEMNFIESIEPKTEPMSDIEDIEENNCSDASDME